MTRIPDEVSALLDDLVVNLALILGGNLVGIYLYGSLTQKAFNPERSDIDLIVVTQRDLSETQFKKVDAWLKRAAKSNPWTELLQIVFLLKDEVLTMNSKACLYQFGKLNRGSSDGNPIFWINILKSGVVLYGARPETFIPKITTEILYDALVREAGYLREEIVEKPDSEWRDVPKYRAYAVLTLCRILYSFAKGTIVSKPIAAKWAIKNVPEELREVILRSLDSDAGRPVDISIERISRFIEFTESTLSGKTAGVLPIDAG